MNTQSLIGYNRKGEFRLHHDINFQTPYNVCRYMVSLLSDGISNVLEPTPGIGNLIAATEERFENINIKAPDDFFLMDRKEKFDAVIMNPPFTSKDANMINAGELDKKMGMRLGYHILTECMKMSDEIIALMPWFTISDSDIRLKELVKYGLKSLTPLPRKTFRYARIQTVVIQLERGYTGKTEFSPFFHKELL